MGSFFGFLVNPNLHPRTQGVLLSRSFTKGEKAIHKKVITAYDLLVNVGTVLIDVEDRLRFLEETYKEIIDIYNIKLRPVEYHRWRGQR